MKTEQISIDKLKPHPKNYNSHPDDQIEHLVKSIKDHGLYRNIVVASDDIILAGHGVFQACQKIGLKEIPIIRLNIKSDDPKALKIVIGDNEISHLSEKDDYKLTELLKEVMQFGKNIDSEINSLLGTGFDERMLAALIFTTRPENEIKDKNAAAEWIGLPEFGDAPKGFKLIIHFENEKNRNAFIKKAELKINGKISSIWWPDKEREDPSSLKFKTTNAK